jgi:deoxycytidylate deaminase
MTNEQILKCCVDQAIQSSCLRSKCGSIIVSKDGEIIGKGFNSQAGGETNRCDVDKEAYDQKVTDKTCCIHAEQRAMVDALKNNIDRLKNSTLYFIRLGDDGKPKESGKPYCTICSKMALDTGILNFALFHDLDNPSIYTTKEYNDLSYNYKNKQR